MRISINVFIFISFFILFFLTFKFSYILFGDFASFFNVNNYYLTSSYYRSWISTMFLGFDSSLYSSMRLQIYLIIDIFKLLFGEYYIIFFISISYFLRYFIFYKFLLFLKVKNNFAILISLFYTFNFYFIDRLGHTYIFVSSIFIPSLIMGYIEYIKLGSKKYFLLLLFSCWMLLSSMHVVLMTVYMSPFLFFLAYKISGERLAEFIKKNLKLGMIMIPLFSLVLIPFIHNKLLSNDNVIDMVAKGANSAIYVYSQTDKFPLTLSGLGFYYSELIMTPLIVLFGYLFLIYALFWIFIKNKNKEIAENFFVYIILLFGFLSSFNLMKETIPFLKSFLFGFSSIKDSGYFIIFCVISILALLGISISKKENEKYILANTYIIFFFFAILFSINIFAFNTFEVFTKSKIPESYKEVLTHIPINNSRILVLPTGWISQFEWSGNKLMSGFFNLFLGSRNMVGQNILEGPSFETQAFLKKYISCIDDLKCADEELLKYFLYSDTRYIINFKGAKNHVTNKSISYENFIDKLSENLNLLPIYENKDYIIYEVSLSESQRERIFIEPYIKGEIKTSNAINNILIKNLNEQKTERVIFLESYHPQWKLYPVSEFSWWKAPFLKPLASTRHYMEYEYANAWNLDETDIIRAKSINMEGGEDVEIVLYFLPQTYFYYGLIMSITTFLSLIIYLSVFYFREFLRKRKDLLK